MTSDLPTRAGQPSTPPVRSAEGRFVPGTVLAGRYRIVALLGRGGMGEVYRAEDLKLGQAVALKFLPPAMAAEPARLARFFAEARLAREVTHPNVCRVHDVGEVDGQQFLSMEYVDGEDLASLLRRIGRLPVDKGLEIARQVCLGLSAAHARGVLHRDLKPANVMIDGRGRARLTDFGLAVLAGDAAAGELAGTPAYMAPEQLAGQAVTVASDVYALGLVLYELFTGRAAFRGTSAEEAARQRETPPAPLRTLVPELEGPIDRVVRRCLEREPAQRPASALAVAAALPGGDPLAAMMAAGETPPPEMVAAAGEASATDPRWAAAALVFVLVATPLAIHLTAPLLLLTQVPLEKPPEVLADRARDLARRFAPDAPPNGQAQGFRYARRLAVDRAGTAAPMSPILFWYRQSPQRLDSQNAFGTVSLEDPPPTRPGMVSAVLDTRGRLVSFESVPGSASPVPPPGWEEVLAEAGLDPSRLRAADPVGIKAVPMDQRRAWIGSAGDPPAAVRAEGATFAGHLTSFEVAPAESAPRTVGRPPPTAFEYAFAVAFFGAIVAGVLLARHNLRLGRGDLQGAWKVAVATFLLRMTAWVLQAPHTTVLPREQTLFIWALGRALYIGALVWVFYMAIEPTVRRHWPNVLISWSRVLAGRWRDPLVGRDVLAASASAVALVLVWVLFRRVPEWLGAPMRPVLTADLDFLMGARRFLGWVLLNFASAMAATLFAVVTVVGFRLLLRRTSYALAASVVLFAALSAQGAGLTRPWDAIPALAVASLTVFFLMRFGFLTMVVVTFLVGVGEIRVPATLDLGAWYGQATVVWIAIFYALAVFGFVVSQGGRAFKGVLPEE